MSEKIDTALRWASERIGACSDSPRLDAEVLLAFCLDKPRSFLYSWPRKRLTNQCWQRFCDLVERRRTPIPIAYLTGEREFYSRRYQTTPVALVPRPETEVLVDMTLGLIPKGAVSSVLELGTGSGIIALTLKAERPQISISATDIDPACIELARGNAELHGLEVEFLISDWYDNLPPSRRFDFVVSNPPYIAGDHPFLAQGDLPAEPMLALSPGATGLEALEPIIRGAREILQHGGWMVLEHGYDQQAPVRELFTANGFSDIRCLLDHHQLPRATQAKLS